MHLVRFCLAALMAFPLAGCLGSNQEPPAAATLASPAAAPVQQPIVPTAPSPATQTAALAPANATIANWGALFVAGDDSITAFDNATRRFYAIIERKPDVNLRRLTSDLMIAPSPDEIADPHTIDAALAFVTKAHQENCLLFMTSHGSKDGFYLSQAGAKGGLLPPDVLDRWLDDHCGTRPTVVIVSACYSGIFMEQGMAQPNRIILTAARRDRTSFGCAADQTYTYFDRCLLDSWTWVYTWQELYDRTRSCVLDREAELGAKPSEPQAYFGPDVASLPMP